VGYDLSSLPPADALVALRSFPRRYRESLQPIEDDESIEEMAQRVGPDGLSMVELVADTVRTWTVQREALRQIRLADTPVIHPAVVDASARQWEAPVHETLAGALAQLADEATELGDEVEHFSAHTWTRSATAAGGASVTALDVVRDAVRVGRDNLDTAGQALAAQRSR